MRRLLIGLELLVPLALIMATDLGSGLLGSLTRGMF